MSWTMKTIGLLMINILVSVCVCEQDYCVKSERQCCRTFVVEEFNQASRSIVVIEPYGRLGNHLTAFAHLYQLREELGVDVYIVNQTRKLMSQVFSETTLQTLPVLEEEFCNIDDIPFRDFDLDIRYILTDESYRKGHILLLLDERVRHLKLNQRTKEYREFIQKFTNSMRSVLQFRPEILEAVDTKMTKIATKFRQKHPTIDQAALITWIGIHNRRTDFNNFAWQKHGLTPFEEEYFVEAMDYYRERFGEAVIFLYVSDDMKWGRLNLMNPKRDLFFVGKGKTEDEDEIAFDMTLLAQCNHSIYTRGTFGIWTAAMAGGLIHHERGVSENVVDI
ncbi:galactoside 2-alpha-L-fucosyltransferase SEC1-like [Tigriopus californicus]|uniref:galactoside 2-alpha-L-fucosyltransferase SEC1-like n=1 Tax=Tigriopus californicus TaxID=6832 RepID=UPI0027DA1A7D|nr:galactoside 2-alpha-L-fucosyltransferase SEC1-like [Tigriopus californicus]